MKKQSLLGLALILLASFTNYVKEQTEAGQYVINLGLGYSPEFDSVYGIGGKSLPHCVSTQSALLLKVYQTFFTNFT